MDLVSTASFTDLQRQLSNSQASSLQGLATPKMPGAHSTYYDRRLRQGQALIRARRPYLVKNAVTGLGLLTIVGGIYYYTLNAVGQDDFEDVKVPEAPRKPTAAK
ncbi:hypothetical protein ACCO45_001060 [Purpureocillium lilacinum]|uniref:Uncharacterized protein n=1 Tax=Purpureocillium lilacinum TaxID=33203 RepID=A0ACC4E6H5_PURLI